MKNVELFLKFSSFNGNKGPLILKEKLCMDSFNFWLKGEPIYSKIKNDEIIGHYKYSTCNFMKECYYEDIQVELQLFIDDFLPKIEIINNIKKDYSLDIVLTIVFQKKSKIIPFAVDEKIIQFLAQVGSALEFC